MSRWNASLHAPRMLADKLRGRGESRSGARLPVLLWNSPYTKKWDLVEAGGIEPPSEGFPPKVTTCLVAVLLSSSKPPATGSCATSRFGSRPHPLRQRNRSIPLNDALSDPAGESRQDAGCLGSQGVILFVCSYLQSCVFNGAAGPRHATLTSHPRRTHIAPKR